MKCSVVILWCAALVQVAIASDEISIHRVTGPEVPGSYKHPATVTELQNGDLYIAYYGGEGEYQGDTAVYGLRLVKGATQWTAPQIIADTPNRSEGNAAVQIDDSYLIAYLRRGGGFGPMKDGVLYRSESRDGGRTWSPGERSQFRNPNSAADFIKLSNGHLLLVFNDNNEGRRTPLTVAISTDDDKSYPYRRNSVDEPGDTAAYPSAMQSHDGKIHIVYTSSGRTVINQAVFDESAILGEKP